jgi:predicted ABC-type ATPase
MPSGSLVLLAGPNGAGKTTAASSPGVGSLLRGFLRLNADDLTLKKLKLDGYAGFADAPPDVLKRYFIQAAEEVYAIATEALLNGVNVSLETVLSTDKYCALVESVLAGGGRFGLIYVALNSPDISLQRVTLRAGKGGHSVPADRLEERWKRSLKWLPWFATRADFFYLFDNSDSNPDLPPALLALLEHTGRTLSWRVSQDVVFKELQTVLSGAFPREVWPHSRPS